jgi:GH18 family chitinase
MKLGQGGWGEQWDAEQQAPYMYQADQWVSYDNTVSVGLKVSLNVVGKNVRHINHKS